MLNFHQWLNENRGLEVKIGLASSDGTLILYINGKRYVYWMDAINHGRIRGLLDSFVHKGKKVPPRPHQALELIKRMIADGEAEQIEPPPKENLLPKNDVEIQGSLF
jgi:hypothetical protein